MKIAAVTLTHDRLAYTQACFPTLLERAGIEFDWYVVDQGSTDGTADWLAEQDYLNAYALDENIGICPALNAIIGTELDPAGYDVIVRYDNDCEVVSHNTLRETANAALCHDWIVAPTVHGLINPPAAAPDRLVGSYLIGETEILGGIFMAMPARLFSEHGYRYDERFPPYTGDEDVCRWWRERGGHVGYLRDWHVNHYLTTEGQHADMPDYFAAKQVAA